MNEALSRWQSYDELFNELSKWLKNFETKLKQETGPRTDLPSKQKQLDVVKVMVTVYCLVNSFVVIAKLLHFCLHFNSPYFCNDTTTVLFGCIACTE